jgi:hypothetical protein
MNAVTVAVAVTVTVAVRSSTLSGYFEQERRLLKRGQTTIKPTQMQLLLLLVPLILVLHHKQRLYARH